MLMLGILDSGRGSQDAGSDVLVSQSLDGRAGAGTLCKGPDYQDSEPRPSECTCMKERLEDFI